jgi:predicted amidohydrolase
MRDIRVAAVCMASPPGEIETNLRKTAHFVEEASARGAEIVCFPELSVSGYTLHEPGRIYSPGKKEAIIRGVEKLAKDRNILILAGLVEPEGEGKPFISHIAAGPDGFVGLYRKTHLSPPEREVFRQGEELKTFSCGSIRFGIELCYESHFPEISTTLSLRGAEILFLPHASPRGTPEEKLQSWSRHLPSRAFDNTVFVVACNQAGTPAGRTSFPGTAMVLDPAGRVIASRAEEAEGMLLAELRSDSMAQARGHRMRYFLPSRRPELYGEVTATKGDAAPLRDKVEGTKG